MDKSFVFELIEKIKDTKIEEIEISTEEGKIHIKQYLGPKEVVMSQPTAPQIQYIPQPVVEIKEEIKTSSEPLVKEESNKKYHVIKSPLVGTFYRAPSPGAPPFVEEGDMVSKGQVLCIIEALKVMNEIESDVDGRVAKILVENGQPVEYGQELFYIEV
ncbi:acetyl-CoA carboxylase biotin carboxyl carrier protein [Sulfurihydrogenibium azorense]|jgi:acetyl-CoA carboxylase biotin carboxyl carrier protein|uniref:Biotin carboxyl carrier protein of acetyl-CoA carboxylase n=1 Tax=Sulfurihydrogenibium azorense (strain DSM 15241 / OCM 825 / Az-Fu1) TaxID=204536 RepID=C1DTH6_SULAA|nr:acetyl-CoA carboxylase biotin carboxyl carrier protein [Sulfurihydrogenibium azorense]ACN99626.1 acetyl-CoA carboxylase, biotin carboxyl carrier protein [Sulfurihydrogenibium azorense Az-Fu1]MDM7273690.1 acetyl-CoA carboxylase biotin carboxyl carrier protein [Sulfurihydrogenibium azorense]